VPLGDYRVALPAVSSSTTGRLAVLFLHGAGGSAAQTLGNAGMVDAFRARGWVVIAGEGSERPGRPGRSWSFHPSRPAMRDEDAYARQVLDDAAARFGVDRDRVLLAGFSVGGSLTWYLACKDPTLAAAYAPVAGAFWRPHPEMGSCAGPVRLLHTHGWRDETVPLEGRPLLGGEILQGDVFHGLEILRGNNGCDGLRADAYDTDGVFWRRWWTRCTPGSALEFALHVGGHSVPPDWAAMAIDWFERTVPATGQAG
jgi:polyhydroxybutyrate depolymerase